MMRSREKFVNGRSHHAKGCHVNALLLYMFYNFLSLSMLLLQTVTLFHAFFSVICDHKLLS